MKEPSNKELQEAIEELIEGMEPQELLAWIDKALLDLSPFDVMSMLPRHYINSLEPQMVKELGDRMFPAKH